VSRCAHLEDVGGDLVAHILYEWDQINCLGTSRLRWESLALLSCELHFGFLTFGFGFSDSALLVHRPS
jgi:hypothetical protein